MELEILTQSFADALSTVSRCINAKSSHPILGCVLIKADAVSQQVTFVGYNLAEGAAKSVEALVETSGEICIPSKLVTDLANKLTSEVIQLKLDGETLHVKAGKSKYKIQTMDASEYPCMPWNEDDDFGVELSAGAIISLLRPTINYASADQARGILTGLNISQANQALSIKATDGYRLAYSSIKTSDSDGFDVIVPATALKVFMKLWGKRLDDVISVSINHADIVLRSDGNVMTSRLLMGQFPNVLSLFPVNPPNRAIVNRKEVIESIERLLTLGGGGCTIKLEFGNNFVTISHVGESVGEGYEEIEIDYTGDNLVLAMNASFVLETLRSVDCEEFAIDIESPIKPITFIPLGFDVETKSLIMPIQIRA